MGGSLRGRVPKFFKVNGAWGFAQNYKTTIKFRIFVRSRVEIFLETIEVENGKFLSPTIYEIRNVLHIRKMLEDRNLSK